MMVTMLHSNGQLRTERDGDTEKGCQKPAVQQKTTDDDDVRVLFFAYLSTSATFIMVLFSVYNFNTVCLKISTFALILILY